MPQAPLDPPLPESSSHPRSCSSPKESPPDSHFSHLRSVQWRIDLGILPSCPTSSIDDLRRVAADSRRSALDEVEERRKKGKMRKKKGEREEIIELLFREPSHKLTGDKSRGSWVASHFLWMVFIESIGVIGLRFDLGFIQDIP